MKEAVLYDRLEEGRVKCTACRRYCVLKDGQTGFCGIRKNIGGKLQLLVYGIPMAVNIDPIEKKPVLHAYPGYNILSLGTTGCNFACLYCQNWQMSQRREVAGFPMSPEEVVRQAVSYGCEGIAYTYNEPTIFIEYARDIGILARKSGLINMFVSNGYETPEALEFSRDWLDIITINFKGNANNDFYRRYVSVLSADPIYDTMKIAHDMGMHVEITDLVVPQIGDDLGDARIMIRKIKEIMGPEVPISFLRFFPDYRLRHLPLTTVASLEEHCRVAREEGMEYVYVGNVAGHSMQSTYCPECGTIVVERDMMSSVIRNLDSNGNCSSCGHHIGIRLGRGETGKSQVC